MKPIGMILLCSASLALACTTESPPAALARGPDALPDPSPAVATPPAPQPATPPAVESGGHVVLGQPVLPACTVLDKGTSLLDDEIPPAVLTQPARLPMPVKTPALPKVARLHEGRPLVALVGTPWPPKVLVADPPRHRVRRLDVTTMTWDADIAVPGAPGQIAVQTDAANGGNVIAAWVALPDEGKVARIDVYTNQVVDLLDTPGRPVAIAVAVGDDLLLETTASPDVLVLGLASPPALQYLTFTGQSLTKVPLDAPPVALREPTVQHVLALLEHGAPVYVTPHWTSEDSGQPLAVEIVPVALRTANPAQLRAAALGQIVSPSVPSSAHAAVCDNGHCYVAHWIAATGFDPTSGVVVPAQYYGGGGTLTDPCQAIPMRPLDVTVSEWDRLGGLSPASGAQPVRDPQTQRDFVARFDHPVDLVRLQALDALVMLGRATGNALILSLAGADPMANPTGEVRLGKAPSALVEVLDPTGKAGWLVALDEQGTAVRRVPLQPLVDAMAAHGPAGLLPAPLVLEADASAEVGPDLLPADLQRGRDLFELRLPDVRLSKAQRFNCSGCHARGGSDGLVWVTSQGNRNTPALAGRLVGTAPYGWSGDDPTLRHHLVESIQRFGGTALAEADLAALQGYLESLVLPKSVASPWQKAVARGKALFEDPSTQCASCHAAPQYQDGMSHDVGTTGWQKAALDTPSLLGLAQSAPYLHDGSAHDLFEVLTKTGKTMGHSDLLSADQRADLVAFLLSL